MSVTAFAHSGMARKSLMMVSIQALLSGRGEDIPKLLPWLFAYHYYADDFPLVGVHKSVVREFL
jgi:hypothetical protein